MSIPFDPSPNVPESWLPGDEILPVSSVGLLLTSGPLDRKPYFYFVEQLDQVAKNGLHPWGIPAGKVEPSDTSIESAIHRELKEETGLVIPETNNISPFAQMYNRNQTARRLVYATEIPFNDLLLSLGNHVVHSDTIKGFKNIYLPPMYISTESFSDEIGRRALVPTYRLFSRDGPILPYYRWDILHHIKVRLEELWVI